MKHERRREPRLRVNLKTSLEVLADRHEAVIRDLSEKGCFVLTPWELSVGESVGVEVGRPGLLHMTLRGVVTRHVSGQGVGVRFKDMTATQQALLTKLIQSLARQSAE